MFECTELRPGDDVTELLLVVGGLEAWLEKWPSSVVNACG